MCSDTKPKHERVSRFVRWDVVIVGYSVQEYVPAEVPRMFNFVCGVVSAEG